MQKNKTLLFLLLIALSSLLVFLSDYLLISDTLYFNTLAEQMSYEQIEKMLLNVQEYKWVSYTILPIIMLIKITLVSVCLSLGLYFYTNQFQFKTAWGVALQAEFLFLLPAFLKILWFLFVQTNYTLQDLQFFYPLSILNLFNHNDLETWLIYPLQVCNLFEVVYWIILAHSLKQAVQQMPDLSQKISNTFNLGRALGLVAAFYGTALVLWIACMMFISVSFSP